MALSSVRTGGTSGWMTRPNECASERELQSVEGLGQLECHPALRPNAESGMAHGVPCKKMRGAWNARQYPATWSLTDPICRQADRLHSTFNDRGAERSPPRMRRENGQPVTD